MMEARFELGDSVTILHLPSDWKGKIGVVIGKTEDKVFCGSFDYTVRFDDGKELTAPAWNFKEVGMNFEVAKELLTARLKAAQGAVSWTLASDAEWEGECPNPGPTTVAEKYTTHMSDTSRVCLGCKRIHITQEHLRVIEEKQLDSWVEFLTKLKVT